MFAVTPVVRSARVARLVARTAAALAGAEVLISVATVLTGGFQLGGGTFRLSSALWSRPLWQACWFAAIAAGFFYLDARLRGQWDALPRAAQQFLSGPADDVRRRALKMSVVVGSVVAILVSCRLARQSIVLGSAEGGWVYGYFQAFSARPLWIFAIVSIVCAAALVVSSRVTRSNAWALVLLWLVIGTGAQALICDMGPYTFGALFAGDTSNSFYSVTRSDDASAVLANFASLREHWPVHAHSNMPGKLMLVYALEHISIDPAVLGWLVVLLSNLGGVLLYIFVRDLFEDRRVALFSLALYLFVPGKLFFFPVLNTATPVVVLAFACLMLRWLRTGRTAWAAAAGAGCFGLVFFEPMPLVLGALFVLMAARAIWRGDLVWTGFLRQAGVFIVAFLAAYGVVRVATGFDLFDAVQRVRADAVAFNMQDHRPYGIWVRQNAIDFLFASGVCQALLFLPALIAGVRHAGDWRRVLGEPIVVFCVGVAAALVAIDLAGVNRGEAMRLWIFLACFVQVPAAWVCVKVGGYRAIALVLMTAVLQCAVGAAVVKFNLP